MLITVEVPNLTQVDERTSYIDIDAFRVVLEDNKIIGCYAPDGLVEDPATMIKVAE